MSNWKGTNDGEFKMTFTSDLKRAIRNKGGLLCTFWKPDKFPNQDERYESELLETKANQELCFDAFNTIQKCDLLPSELLEQRNELFEMVNYLRGGFLPSTNSDLILLEKANELINKISK